MNELFYTVNCFEKICCMLNSKAKTSFCIFENKLNYAYWRLIYKPNSPIMSWFPIFIIYKSNKNIEAITATNSFFFSFDWLPEKKKNVCIAKGNKNLETFIRKKLKNRILVFERFNHHNPLVSLFQLNCIINQYLLFFKLFERQGDSLVFQFFIKNI